MSPPKAFIVLSLLAAAGPLAGQTTPVRDGDGRERLCQPAEFPKDLPPGAALLDTTVFGARIAGVTVPNNSPSYLFSVLFREGQGAATVRLLEPAVGDSALLEVVRATLRPQRRGPWGLRLRVTLGAPRVLTVERSVYCPPVPAPDPISGPGETRVARPGLGPLDGGPAGAKASQRTQLVAKVRLSAAGTVADIQLTSRSGIVQLDDWFVLGLKAARYLPALFDGLPIPSWYRTDGTRLRL